MKKTIAIIMAAIALCVAPMQAQMTIIDKGRPSKLIQTGVRLGFNSANLATNYDKVFPSITWNHTQWRQGLSMGAIIDLNIRNFFAIQSGIYYKSVGNVYHYLINRNEELVAIDGKWRGNYFEVPVLASFRLGVPELAQLQFDLGPYFATGFGGKVKYDIYENTEDVPSQPQINRHKVKADYFGDHGMVHRFDWGVKFGGGLLVLQHYYIGAHYSYSCRNVLKDIDGGAKRPKGHNKLWTFTFGYNF